MSDKLRLSIVIPAYNEEARILLTLEKIIGYLSQQEYKYEIIIVDDGSSDKTSQVCRNPTAIIDNSSLIRLEKNKGKGYAIRTGILRARGEYVLFIDADNSTPITEIEKCYPPFNSGYDIVIGSRRLSQSKIEVHQPFYREFMGKVFRIMATNILALSVTDITCGFKCFRKEAAQSIFGKQRLARWGFDAEILFLAKKYGFKIKEIPVTWSDSFNTKVSLGIDTLRSFTDIIRILINNFRNFY